MNGLDLVFSPDEGGWYWQRHSDWATSSIFKTRKAAERSYRLNKIRWSKPKKEAA